MICRLQLPRPIIENDDSDGIYDSDKGDFYLRFAKINKGEHFENLDLITNLLAPPKKKKNFNNIEIIGNFFELFLKIFNNNCYNKN